MSRMIGRTLTRLALLVLIALTRYPLAAQTPEVSVTPDGEEWTVQKGQTNVLIVFSVANVGGSSASLTFTCTGTNGLSCVSLSDSSMVLGPYEADQVRVRFDAPSYAIVGTITLVARYQGQWIDSGVYVVTVEGANPTVSPDGGTLNAVVGPGPDSAVFVIHNAGYVSGEISFACSSRKGRVACGSSPAPITLGAGQQDTVVQTFNGLQVGVDTLTFTASSDGKSDTGHYVVTVTSSGSTPKVLPGVPSVFFEVQSDTTERTLDFAVVNESGQGAGTYVLTCVPSGPWTELDAGQKRCEVTPEDTMGIAEGDTVPVEVRFKTLGGITGTGTIRVTATVQGDPAKTAWGQTVVEVGYPPDTLGGTPPLVQAVFPPSSIAVWDSGSVTFTVENRNEGNDTVYYALDCKSSGRVACVVEEIEALIPDGYQAQTQVELWGVHEGVDTLRYIATDTVADVADTATVIIQAIGEAQDPVVTPDGAPVSAVEDLPVTLPFYVANGGTGTGVYSLACGVTQSVSCSAPGQDTVPPWSTDTVSVSFTPPAGGTYTLRLVATGVAADTGWYAVTVGQLTVQPKGASTQLGRGGVDTLTFEVRYTGSYDALTVVAHCDPALSSCQASTSSLNLGSGQQTTANVAVPIGPASQAGNAWVSLVVATTTASPQASDSGWVSVTVIEEPGPPQVQPKGDTLYYRLGQGAQPRFSITNPGTAVAQYNLTCSLSGVPGGCTVQSPLTVLADSTKTVTASVTPPDTLIRKVTLRASGVPPLDSGWVFVRPVQLGVTPKGLGPRRVVQADTTFLETFTVYYRGPAREITLQRFRHGVVTSCTAASSVLLGFGTQLGDSTSVQVECETADQPSTGRVGLVASTADEPPVADSGWVDVRLPMSLTVDDANPGLEELRGECLSIAAGAGAIECDDFRYVYPFMPVKRLNRVRNIGLQYISATAHGRKVIGANLLVEGGSAVQSVKGLMSIDGVDVDSILHQDSIPRNKATRFAFEVPEPPASGMIVVPYEVRMVVTRAGSPPSVDTLTAEGRYLQLDRTEEFGRGWWPTGYESLTPVTDATLDDALLWTGGGGSARVYVKDTSQVQADTPWVAVTRGVADTIREASFVVPGTVGASGSDTARYLDLNGSEGGAISAGQHSGLTSASKMT